MHLEIKNNFIKELFVKRRTQLGFPGGAVVGSLPANSGDTV